VNNPDLTLAAKTRSQGVPDLLPLDLEPSDLEPLHLRRSGTSLLIDFSTGEAAMVEGVKGTWRVDPSLLGQPFSGRAALLSPFDRLLHDRKRTVELFGFDYQLEMYKPAAKRRWGYWAMPVLDGDELVGKVDATADREAGVLIVDAVHEDGDWSAARRASARGQPRSVR